MKKNSNNFIKKYLPWIILAGIIIIAIFFRFYKLNSLPPGLHPDEAANGLDIILRIQKGDLRIIYNTNGPREALFFYLQAIFVYLMGNTILALRMAPALMGVFSVVVVYFATKEWFSRRTALIAAFIFAINPWVVIIQRDGFRASLVPLFIGLVMWFGAKAYKTNKLLFYCLAAISLALGFYTYTAFSLITVGLLGSFIYLAVFRRDWVKANYKKLIISFMLFIALLVPLGLATINDPQGSASRAGGTSFLNKDLNNGKPVETLISGTFKTLLQYNYQGDSNSRHNLPTQPLLNFFIGLMFILGLIISFSNFKKPRYAILLILFFTMMLPVILTAEGLPHALRSIGTAVPAIILSALGINYLLYIWYRTFPVNRLARTLGLAMVLTLLGLSLIQSYRQYFVTWAQDQKTYDAYSETAVKIAMYMNSNNKNNRKNYVLMSGYESNPVKYLTDSKSEYTLVEPSEFKNLPIGGGSKLIFIPAGSSRDQLLEIAKAKFPKGKSFDVTSDYNGRVLFSVYEVNE